MRRLTHEGYNMESGFLSVVAPSRAADWARSVAKPSGLVLDLVAYWNRVRGGRLAPRWPDIDPGEIKRLLPNVIVSEVLTDPFDIRYRIVGSEIVAKYGYDFTWKSLRSIMNTNAESYWWLEFYQVTVEYKQSCYGRYRIDFSKGTRYVDGVTLILSSDGKNVDRLIELEDWSQARGITSQEFMSASWRYDVLSLLPTADGSIGGCPAAEAGSDKGQPVS
jgi:hypothetical protein